MVTDFDNPPASVLRPMKLAHVVLRTTDLPRLEKYYLAFLDATVSFKNEMMSFLRYDEEHHRIGMLAILGSIPKVPKAAGLAHIAFTYGTLSDLLKSYRKRKSAGIVPTWCVNHGPTISIYYKDPDGNEIETQVDIMDPEEVEAFMTSGQYHTNPIGVDFDAEDLIQKLKDGVDEKTLLVRPDIGPREPPALD